MRLLRTRFPLSVFGNDEQGFPSSIDPNALDGGEVVLELDSTLDNDGMQVLTDQGDVRWIPGARVGLLGHSNLEDVSVQIPPKSG